VTALAVSLAGWAVFEIGLRVREARQGKGGRARDRGTRVLIALSIGVAIFAAAGAPNAAPGLDSAVAVQVVGVGVLWLGLAVRIWAVATLGAAFRTTVEVDSDQAVVSRGPYRWVRHPSYAGLLLIVAGFGLAVGNWLSFAAALVLTLPAFVRRIHVEEAELERVLGDAYRSYETGRARLVPGLW
jgi:protein-S-isoprenylcysteine O-methyltransferase Ste14